VTTVALSTRSAGVALTAATTLALAGLLLHSQQASAAVSTVRIAQYAFAPASITVHVGDTVTWVNQDAVAHTVTSRSGGLLNSPMLSQGQSYSYRFTNAGTYYYYCAVHPNMLGTVTVLGPAPPTPAPTAARSRLQPPVPLRPAGGGAGATAPPSANARATPSPSARPIPSATASSVTGESSGGIHSGSRAPRVVMVVMADIAGIAGLVPQLREA
jgi:amicyanin